MPSSRRPFPSRLLGGLGMLVTVAACAGCAATSGHGSTAPATHSADTAVAATPQPLKEAIAEMQHATNFSFTATVIASNSTTRLLGQFEAPDREHLVLTPSAGSSSELLFIGSKTYLRGANGTWQDTLGGVQGSSNPRAAFGALAGSSCVPASVPGTSSGTGFSCTLAAHNAAALVRGAAASGAVHCSVTINGADISELKLRGQGFAADIIYANVGTTPPVPQPL